MIESTCIYLKYKNYTLFLYRNKKKDDLNAGYYIGVGGKKEKGESFKQCAFREITEEIRIRPRRLTYRGTVYFTYGGIKEKILIYNGFLDSMDVKDCNEGTLVWVKDKDVKDLRVWEGDRYFLAQALKPKGEKFVYTLKYDEGGILIRAMKGRDYE